MRADKFSQFAYKRPGYHPPYGMFPLKDGAGNLANIIKFWERNNFFVRRHLKNGIA